VENSEIGLLMCPQEHRFVLENLPGHQGRSNLGIHAIQTTSGGNMKYFALFCALCFAVMASAQSIGFGVHGNMINSKINATIKELVTSGSTTGTAQVALDEVYGLGIGGGVHFDIGLSVLSIRISGDYTTLSPDKDKFKAYVQTVMPGFPVSFVDGGKIDMYSGNANLKLVVLPIPVLNPYITGGVGVANIKATDVTLAINNVNLKPISILKNQTVATFNAGVGTDIKFGGVAVFAEVKVNWLSLDEGSYTMVPIATAGITF
jgi:opacity protein-like surface antigen